MRIEIFWVDSSAYYSDLRSAVMAPVRFHHRWQYTPQYGEPRETRAAELDAALIAWPRRFADLCLDFGV